MIQHVDANGLRFAHLEEGKGPLVLLARLPRHRAQQAPKETKSR